MCINLRCVQPYMTQHSLDIPDVRSSFEHQRRHRVTKDMTSPRLTDIRGPDVAARQPTEVVWCKWFPRRGKEYDAFIRLHHELGPQLCQVFIEPSQSSISDRNHTVPFPFAL